MKAPRFAQWARRHHRLLLGGGLAYLLFLVALAPASLAGWALEKMSEGRVRATGASGTLWNGELRGMTWRGDDVAVRLGRLTWHWQPVDLARLRLGFRVKLGDTARGDLEGHLGAGFGFVFADRLDGRLPAALLGDFNRAVALFRPDGEIALEARDFSVAPDPDGGRIGGRLSAHWRDARSSLASGRLGDYTLRVTAAGDGKSAILALSTARGPVHISGNGSWQPGRPGGFDALFRLPPEAARDMAQLKDMLGPVNADGVQTLRVNW